MGVADRKTFIERFGQDNYQGFRLDPNWATVAQPQIIQAKIVFDDIDRANVEIINRSVEKLNAISDLYSQVGSITQIAIKDSVAINIRLNRVNNSYQVEGAPKEDLVYLNRYHYFKELIDLHNREYAADQIPTLTESFTLIGSYRNYTAFTPAVSLSSPAGAQVQQIRNNESGRSANANDQGEPSIFNIVRLRTAEAQQARLLTRMNLEEATLAANSEPFLISINNKLQVVNLKVEIRVDNINSWSYGFLLKDTKRNRDITDVNSLSAGQKAILHLVFESYGRGDLKGGVTVIDEPEIHLHYQFQHEYLRIVEDLGREQSTQYVIVHTPMH